MIQPVISAIIACYKDDLAIPIMAERLKLVFGSLNVEYEIIFVNDGSPDCSQDVLERLAKTDQRIKVITHSRNFGSQNAFSSGLLRARGQACVLLDGDLQDPPELIVEFVRRWREGNEVVFGVRVRREMSRLIEFGYKLFYRLFRRFAYIDVPVDAGDFSLIDRKVVDVLNAMPERDRFVRGLRAWVGFRQVGVPYVRPERMFGYSTNNLWSNIRWAKKGIFSFSYAPLEAISIAALGMSGLSFFAACFQVVARLLHPEMPHGIATIIVVIMVVSSLNFLFLAFIAEYVSRMFEEVKRRPLFVVTKTLNFEPERERSAVHHVCMTTDSMRV